jgi:hypothetical protein
MPTRRLRAGALTGIAATALVTACGGVSSGIVENKAYDPPVETMYFICGAYNQQGMCTVQVPIFETVPECWRLDLVNAGEHGSVCVPPEQWGAAEVGDRWGTV